jgi:signal transduction histidine kinase
VGDLLDDIEPLTAPQRREKRLVYRVERCDRSMVLRGDRVKLARILVNLVANAVKFTPEDGTISLSTDRPTSHMGRICVRDTGIGMGAEQVRAAFEPFTQFTRSGGASQGGVGLGLAISRELARGMGGELELASEAGSGCEFTLSIPLAAPRG